MSYYPYSLRRSKKNKYNAKSVEYDGIKFDSKKEARRYFELKLLEKAGEIEQLQRQTVFELIPAQYVAVPRYGKNGKRLKDGVKCVEQKCVYIADFTYLRDGELVVEDVKGYRDPRSAGYAKFVIKRKLMRWRFGIEIIEV